MPDQDDGTDDDEDEKILNSADPSLSHSGKVPSLSLSINNVSILMATWTDLFFPQTKL